MDLSLIVVRLKATLTGLKSVGAVVDLNAAIGSIGLAVPAAFVLPLADGVQPIDMTGSVGGQVTQSFGVVHVLSNKRDAKGDAALADLVVLRSNLTRVLLGWIPDAVSGEPVYRTGGRLLSLDGDGRLWWIDEFQLKTYEWST